MTDEQKFSQAVLHLTQRVNGELTFTASVPDWIALIANLQLAMRHPGNVGDAHDAARKFVDRSIALIEITEPELATLLRRGDAAGFDVPTGEARRGS